MADLVSSLLLGDGLDGLPHSSSALLPVDHNLEALEIGQISARLPLGELLSEGSGGPLGGDLGSLASLHEGAGAGAAGNRDLHPGEGQSFQW